MPGQWGKKDEGKSGTGPGVLGEIWDEPANFGYVMGFLSRETAAWPP